MTKKGNQNNLDLTVVIPSLDSIALQLQEALSYEATRLSKKARSSLDTQERRGLLDLTRTLAGLLDIENKSKADAISQLPDDELWNVVAEIITRNKEIRDKLRTKLLLLDSGE